MPRRPISFAILLALLTAVLPACRYAPPRPARADSAATHVIFVVRRSWHIDIGFPAEDLVAPLASVQADFQGAAYLDFGFGDRHYLMNPHHGAGNLLAALWPGPGLLLLTALRATPQQAFGDANVVQLAVTAEQSRQVQRFIWQTLSKTSGPVNPVANGPYGGSVFYAAAPSYSALHTCNTWAAQALQAAPLPVRSKGVEFAGQVWSQVQRLPPRP